MYINALHAATLRAVHTDIRILLLLLLSLLYFVYISQAYKKKRLYSVTDVKCIESGESKRQKDR